MIEQLGWLAGGLVVLVFGAEYFVRGAAAIAARFGLSPAVIGVTVVAWGTSMPELFVSVGSALENRPALAVGNVVGSNLLNVLLILGASALIVPLSVASRIVRFEVPVMVVASLLGFGLALDGQVSRVDGLVLLAVLVFHTLAALRSTRTAPDPDALEGHRPLGRALLAFAVGLGGLALGARWFVHGAVGLAQALGLSDVVVGLTVVALGTSLPEVATSLVAAARGQRDIAVGNVIGSNLFNLVGVLGATAAIAPGGVPIAPATLVLDLPFMVVVAVACLPICWTRWTVERWEGALLLALFCAYTTYLVLGATDPERVPAPTTALWVLSSPLLLVTLLAFWPRPRAAS